MIWAIIAFTFLWLCIGLLFNFKKLEDAIDRWRDERFIDDMRRYL